MDASYHLELSPAAHRDLKRLPQETQHEIVMTHLPRIQAEPYARAVCHSPGRYAVNVPIISAESQNTELYFILMGN